MSNNAEIASQRATTKHGNASRASATDSHLIEQSVRRFPGAQSPTKTVTLNIGREITDAINHLNRTMERVCYPFTETKRQEIPSIVRSAGTANQYSCRIKHETGVKQGVQQ